jgi:hypothetical protein
VKAGAWRAYPLRYGSGYQSQANVTGWLAPASIVFGYEVGVYCPSLEGRVV